MGRQFETFLVSPGFGIGVTEAIFQDVGMAPSLTEVLHKWANCLGIAFIASLTTLVLTFLIPEDFWSSISSARREIS